MNTNDIKDLAVETIYLVPDSSEGQRCYLWCDDPAPGVGMDPSEAVEYVRKDVHEAIIAKQAKAAIRGMDASKAVGSSNLEQAKRLHAECNPDALESERAANALLTERIAELEEREQALTAHVEELKEHVSDSNEMLGELRKQWHRKMPKSAQDVQDQIAFGEELISRLCATSLARRDLIKQAEVLEGAADEFEVHERARQCLKWKAEKLRQQAEGLQ